MRKPKNLRSLLNRKAALAIGAGVAIVAVSGGAAFAYWTTSGSGTGSATTGTNQAVTITQTGTTSGLVPGGAAQAVNFKITNPLTTPQYVTSVTVAITASWSAQADSAKPACTAADYTLVQPNAISADLAAGDTAFSPSGASIALKDTSANQDNCKGVTVPLTFTSN
ncbi:MAG TPA: hypothetical protein VJT31_29445 [Rugosimonospora sp.]|nr:hypothetical protein [Rugosimonospora sp.]